MYLAQIGVYLNLFSKIFVSDIIMLNFNKKSKS